MQNTWWISMLCAALVAVACAGPEQSTGPEAYVIEVNLQTFDAKKSQSTNGVGSERIERDTVQAASEADAYSKGIQKYAATLLDVHRNGEETRSNEGKLAVYNSSGANIIDELSQSQRDSVLMNFIHFARRASIPYYEHVKDFELKVMAVR